MGNDNKTIIKQKLHKLKKKGKHQMLSEQATVLLM